MKKTIRTISRTLFTGVVFTIISAAAIASDKWVACGDNQLLFYDIQNNAIKETQRVNWSALTVAGEFSAVNNLNGIVECKPVNNGQDLLVTSWLGGVARINMANLAVNFSAFVPHAHSAELLPNNRIAVIGHYLRIFDDGNGKTPLIEIPQDDGHGISWDAEKNILYALSEDFIEEFTLEQWDTAAPKLKSISKTRLPGQSDGHDLLIMPNGLFLVSTRDGFWHFNPATRQFTPHKDLNPLYRAQSVAETDSHLVWVQAEQSWWARGFFVKHNGNEIQRVDTPGIRLYKVRPIYN